MEIQQRKENEVLIISLAGRFDATWSGAVEKALTGAIRSGEHQIHLDMSQTQYISSAALRVLIATHRQIQTISGRFVVRDPSVEVLQVLELSGLRTLLVTEVTSFTPSGSLENFQTARASWEVFGSDAESPASLEWTGSSSLWKHDSPGVLREFPTGTIGFGIGAFAGTEAEAAPYLGEFLAVAGCAAYLPSGDSNRPDFLVSQENLKPLVWLHNGLSGKVTFSRLLRFEAASEARTVCWEEIVKAGLERAGGEAAVFVVVTEVAGLIGASLRKSPRQMTPAEDPMAFPGIRDWLNFTSERAFRDSTAVIVGVAAKSGGAWNEWLRPLAADSQIEGHFHACVFPYRPIRKGDIVLEETVESLFEAEGLQSVLHLVNDSREIEGAGQSEFYRGAVWVAPLTNKR